MISGIYTWTNLIDGKIYIGLTDNLSRRLRQHSHELKNNKHYNNHLQSAWNKYGEENFKFELLLECEIEHLYSEEHYWCNLLNVHDDRYGYNNKPTDPNKKSRFSEETRKKIGNANRAIRQMKPYRVTDEIKAIIGKSSIERWKNDEYRSIMTNTPKEKLSKRVYKYDAEGMYVETFESISEAVRKNQGNLSRISTACNIVPHRYKVKGYYWSFSKVEKLEIANHPKRKNSKN